MYLNIRFCFENLASDIVLRRLHLLFLLLDFFIDRVSSDIFSSSSIFRFLTVSAFSRLWFSSTLAHDDLVIIAGWLKSCRFVSNISLVAAFADAFVESVLKIN